MGTITGKVTGEVTVQGQVTVPMGIVPRGNIDLIENGVHDVTQYQTATVDMLEPSGSMEITENGTFDVTALAEVVANVKGDTNIIEGTFTTVSSQLSTGSVILPYEGDGYPLAVMIFTKGGLLSASDFKQYDVCAFFASKWDAEATPTWASGTALDADRATAYAVYNNGGATALADFRTAKAVFYSEGASPGTIFNCVKFHSPASFVYYTGNSTRNGVGLVPGKEYEYHVVYSK